MKALGYVLTTLSLMVTLALVWVGFIVTFQESRIPPFESTPREGWDYWLRMEFWNDLRWFTAYLLIAVSAVSLPLVATLRLHRGLTGSERTDRILLAVTLTYSALVLYVLSDCLRASSPLALAPAILLPGCLYSCGVFARRVLAPGPITGGGDS